MDCLTRIRYYRNTCASQSHGSLSDCQRTDFWNRLQHNLPVRRWFKSRNRNRAQTIWRFAVAIQWHSYHYSYQPERKYYSRHILCQRIPPQYGNIPGDRRSFWHHSSPISQCLGIRIQERGISRLHHDRQPIGYYRLHKSFIIRRRKGNQTRPSYHAFVQCRSQRVCSRCRCAVIGEKRHQEFYGRYRRRSSSSRRKPEKKFMANRYQQTDRWFACRKSGIANGITGHRCGYSDFRQLSKLLL